MKLTQTDHNEQSLPIDSESSKVLRKACQAMIDYSVGTIEMRGKALGIYQLLEDPDKEDKPAIFQKTHGIIITCFDCGGTRTRKIFPDDRNEEIEFHPCPTCKGEGQLFQEVIRKMYVPTEYHRKKLSK